MVLGSDKYDGVYVVFLFRFRGVDSCSCVWFGPTETRHGSCPAARGIRSVRRGRVGGGGGGSGRSRSYRSGLRRGFIMVDWLYMHFLHLLHGVLAHEARVGSEVHGRVAGERDCVFPLVGGHIGSLLGNAR